VVPAGRVPDHMARFFFLHAPAGSPSNKCLFYLHLISRKSWVLVVARSRGNGPHVSQLQLLEDVRQFPLITIDPFFLRILFYHLSDLWEQIIVPVLARGNPSSFVRVCSSPAHAPSRGRISELLTLIGGGGFTALC
jgi:hypothetical protein